MDSENADTIKVIRLTTFPRLLPISSTEDALAKKVDSWMVKILTQAAEFVGSAEHSCRIMDISVRVRSARLYLKLSFPNSSIYQDNDYTVTILLTQDELVKVTIEGMLHPNVNKISGLLLVELHPEVTIADIVCYVEDMDTEVHTYGIWDKSLFDVLVEDCEKFRELANQHWKDTWQRNYGDMPELVSCAAIS